MFRVGVLKDWQRYKQLETERRAEDEAERLALMKRLTLSCNTEAEEQRLREKEAAAGEGLEDLDEVGDHGDFIHSPSSIPTN